MRQADGRIAVVTGGTGVLGGEVALKLAAEGYGVGVLGRNHERADEAVERIRDAGGRALALVASAAASYWAKGRTDESGWACVS